MTQPGSRPAWRRDKWPNADAERIVTTNVWAFLRLLAASGGPDLYDWPSLVAWAHAHPSAFSEAMVTFLNGEGDTAWAEPVLFLDLRPDDRLLAAGQDAWPWQHGASLRAAPSLHTAANATTLLADAAAIRATVVVAPTEWLEEAMAGSPDIDLACLRVVLGLGGPIPAATRQALAQTRPGIVLLARQGALIWGSPLDRSGNCLTAAPALGAWAAA